MSLHRLNADEHGRIDLPDLLPRINKTDQTKNEPEDIMVKVLPRYSDYLVSIISQSIYGLTDSKRYYPTLPQSNSLRLMFDIPTTSYTPLSALKTSSQ